MVWGPGRGGVSPKGFSEGPLSAKEVVRGRLLILRLR